MQRLETRTDVGETDARPFSPRAIGVARTLDTQMKPRRRATGCHAHDASVEHVRDSVRHGVLDDRLKQERGHQAIASAVANSGLPGSQGVGRAMQLQDSQASRNAQLDSLANQP